jgi:hypothetical protein
MADNQRQKEEVDEGAGGERDEPNVEETGQSRLPESGGILAPQRRKTQWQSGGIFGHPKPNAAIRLQADEIHRCECLIDRFFLDTVFVNAILALVNEEC